MFKYVCSVSLFMLEFLLVQVDYSPSSITTLTKEPGYTPAPSSQPQQANYTPSSLCLKGKYRNWNCY